MSSIFAKFKDYQIILYISLLFTSSLVILKWDSVETSVPSHQSAFDTLIPYGFVLFPIEIENHQLISELIKSHGVVNIYYTQPDNNKALLILEGVKLIRSSHDPRYFGLLLNEKNSDRIANYPGPFKVVIQNRNKPFKRASKKSSGQKVKRKIISYED